MRKATAFRAAHILWAAGVLALPPVTPAWADPEPVAAQIFPALPFPPAIEGLIGLPQTYTKGRSAYLALITSEAERRGLPAAIADAVAKVESGFNPNVVGGVGEVGLMQVRPQTAAMLGYKGDTTGLFEPETNVRFGVAYLARAWELAKGDVCRTLMKYRAGWGEERMTPLSVEYCRRARGHLAAIGSPLAGGASPASAEPATPFAARQTNKLEHAPSSGPSGALTATASRLAPSPSVQPSTEPVKVKATSIRTVKPPGAERKALDPGRETLGTRRQIARLRPAVTTSTVATARTTLPPLPPERLPPLPNMQPSTEPVKVQAASLGTVRPPRARPRALALKEEALGPKQQIARTQPAPTPSIRAATRAAAPPLPPERQRVASVGAVKLSDAQTQALPRAREQERMRAERRRRIWVEHEGRMEAITAKLNARQLKIMSGL